MSEPQVKSLEVEGATLHYEVSGQGPVLLMISGGPTDAAIYMGLAPAFTDRYTVVCYDPRGNSRSSLAGSPAEQQVEVHSNDAHLLLKELAKDRGDEPAYVFGSSGGAVVALDLVARHPEQVRTVVAHEPPLVQLLPDSEEWLARLQDVYDTYRDQGVGPAMEKFLVTVDPPKEGAPPQGPPDMSAMPPELLEMFGRMQANSEFFVANVLLPFNRYVPDVEALKNAPTQVVLAAGEGTEGKAVRESSLLLAERTGVEVAHFPGEHQGFMTHGPAFAAALSKVLDNH
jgi:pimeloyl-ACP methyl ester carboxylesterase